MSIFEKLCSEVPCLQCLPRQTVEVCHATPEYDFDSLPLKKTDTATKVKAVVDVVTYNHPLDIDRFQDSSRVVDEHMSSFSVLHRLQSGFSTYLLRN